MPQIHREIKQDVFFTSPALVSRTTSSICNTPTYTSGLTVSHHNIRSIFNKSLDVVHNMSTHNIDFMSFNETWLTSSISNASLYFPNYHFFRLDRSASHGGGILILVKSCYHASIVNTIMDEIIELLHIVVTIHHMRPIHIISVYRPPRCSTTAFITRLVHFLQSCYVDSQSFIILGDMNIDMSKSSAHTKQLIAQFLALGLRRVASTEPTRVTPNSSTLIDVAFANCLDMIRDYQVCDSAYSDHRQLLFRYKKGRNHMVLPTYIKLPDYRNVPASDFANALCTLDHQSEHAIATEASPSDALDHYCTHVDTVIKRYVPTRSSIVHDSIHPYITPYFIQLCSQRDRVLKLCKSRPHDTAFRKRYRSLRNRCAYTCRQLRRDYFSRTLSKCRLITDPRSAWKVLRNCLPHSTQAVSDTNHLVISGKRIDDPIDIANAFNDHYCSVVCDIHALHFSAATNHCTCLLTHTFSDTFEFHEIDTDVMSTYICKVKKTDATIFSIPPVLLHRFVTYFSTHLSRIFNSCIRNSVFPMSLKCAMVRPIHKKGPTSEIDNYRPISILPNISKIFEGILVNQIRTYLDTNSLLYTRQYGFRRHHSTSSCCTDFLNVVLMNLDQGMSCAAVYIDLSKAFDVIDHRLLLHKVAHMFNFSDRSCNLLSSYLSQRYQCVTFNNVCSAHSLVRYGVPQGSIMGPLLFIMYINDMCISLTHSSLIVYADDSTLVHAHKDNRILCSELNVDLANMFRYCQSNKLLINKDKTKVMFFGKPSVRDDIVLCNTVIEVVDSFKLLGLYIDANLKFVSHIDHVIGKLCTAAYIVRKFRSSLPVHILHILFNCLGSSHLTYCFVCYYHCLRKTSIRRLTSMYLRCGRSILGCDTHLSGDTVLSRLSWLNIQERSDEVGRLLIRKILETGFPAALALCLNKINHSHHTRHAQCGYTRIHVNTTHGSRSFSYWAPIMASNM